MAVQQTLKNTVLAKSGTLPIAIDVITTDGFVLVSPKIKSGDYNDIGAGSMGNTKTFIDPNYVTAQFDIPVKLKKSSALGTPPMVDELLKIAGMAETITASTKVDYTAGGTTTAGTGQVKVFNDGYSYTVTGAAANCKISAKIGEPLTATFSVQGFTSAAATAEANPSVTLDTGTLPLVTKVTVFTVGGSSIQADSFEFDAGNKLGENYAIGLAEFYLQDFDPSISITAIKVKGTDEAAWTDYAAGTVRAILITVGTAGSQIEISVPFAFATEVTQSDDAGKVKLTRKFRCQNSVGNDNYKITWK